MNVRFLLLLLPLLVIGCTNDEPFTSRDVNVTIENMPMLGALEGAYVLWFSYPEDPTADKANALQHGDESFVAVGRFLVDDAGAIVPFPGEDLNFTLPAGYNPQLVFDAIVTIEAPGDIPEDPGARLLAGDVRGTEQMGAADLRLSGGDAFGRAFEGLDDQAFYMLTTPSTAATDDERSGIWFLATGSRPGLNLPTLPTSRDNDQWSYQGWAVSAGDTPERLSLGRFLRSDTLDLDAAGTQGGPVAVGLDVPGSDFVTGTPRDFSDGSWSVVVSLDPTIGAIDRPFFDFFRTATIPAGAETGVAGLMPLVFAAPLVSVEFDR